MKTSNQLKALVRNLSKAKNVEAEVILRNFMLERFLERISISDYKHNFILKGGMLISAIVGIDTRTTMDMDATIKGQTLTASEIISESHCCGFIRSRGIIIFPFYYWQLRSGFIVCRLTVWLTNSAVAVSVYLSEEY